MSLKSPQSTVYLGTVKVPQTYFNSQGMLCVSLGKWALAFTLQTTLLTALLLLKKYKLFLLLDLILVYEDYEDYAFLLLLVP